MLCKTKTSLEAKLCIYTMGLLFAVLLGVGHYAMTQQKAALVEQQREAFRVLAEAIAVASEPVVSDDGARVGRRILERLSDTQLDIDYIVVTDQAGKPLFAHSGGGPQRRLGLPITVKARKLAGHVIGYESIEDSIYRTTLPIRMSADKNGAVAVGFSLRRVNDSIDELQTNILLVFVAAFILGITGSVVLARGITRQLRKLIETAKAVGSGDLTRKLEATSGDEVGQLTQAFNAMTIALQENHSKLVERANTDSLTDLYNHRYLQERLTAELSRATRYKHKLSILMIDIDNFKIFNDQYGHPCGDRALKDIAQTMKAELRDMDVVARYGGEEFAVILPESGVEDAIAAGERLRCAVRKRCFYGSNNETVPMTISVGVAQFPIHSLEREGLIMAADMALYRAKHSGRDRTCCYEQQLSDNPAGDPYKVHVLLRATDLRTVEALAGAIDAKHRFPSGHSKRVAAHARKVAEAMIHSSEECEATELASLLRDIGQLALPDAVINKPEPLSPEDREIVASHPSLGHSIVEKSPVLKSMLPGILHHHENYDGSGYPFALSGDDIPLVARIIAVADAYHSMVNDRPHRPKLSQAEAVEELKRCAGRQFDPKVVEEFLRILQSETLERVAA